MKYFYLSIFLLGLALAVQVMLHGVERWRMRRSVQPSAVLNPPTFAALAAGFGIGGYLLTTRSTLERPSIFLLSLVIGVGAHFGMTVLMARWAFRQTAPVQSEEDDINGQVATVTRAILPGQPGEISWTAWEKRHSIQAVGMSESSIPEGSEVVIDVVQDGIAHVELWSVVESRL